MNRWTNQFAATFEKRVIDVFGKVSFAGAGVPTLSAVNSKGIISITRNATGLYTFVFGTNSQLPKDTYVKLLHASAVFNSGVSAPAAPIMNVVADNVAVANVCSLQVQFRDAANAAADPASGEILYIDFTMGDSTAP